MAFFTTLPRRQEASAVLTQTKFALAEAQYIHRHRGCHSLCRNRSDGGTLHSESRAGHHHLRAKHFHVACGEDEEEIEEYVQSHHHHTHHARHHHIARTAEHAVAEHRELEGGQTQRDDGDVNGRRAADVLSPTQPSWQERTDGKHRHSQQQANHQHGHDALAQSGTCTYGVVAAKLMADLNVEAGSRSRTDAAHQPHGGLHQSDGSRSGSAKAAHHRSVDILHHRGGELGEYGRRGKTQHEPRLLGERHRRSLTYHSEKYVLLVIAIHYCEINKEKRHKQSSAAF